MKVLRVLDIDLDFFLNERAINRGKYKKRRLSNVVFKPWEETEVRKFLEINCGLSKMSLTKGRFFQFHDEVFKYLRVLQQDAKFNLLFDIDHIDAHADLGGSDNSPYYISSEFLHQTVTERIFPRTSGYGAISPGNFLLFLISCQWVSDLQFITNLTWDFDVPFWPFKNCDVTSRIQLRKYSKEQMQDILENYVGCMDIGIEKNEPIDLEPEVPFKAIHYPDFRSTAPYDLIFLTQSPSYTPKESDKLIPIIRSYFKE